MPHSISQDTSPHTPFCHQITCNTPGAAFAAPHPLWERLARDWRKSCPCACRAGHFSASPCRGSTPSCTGMPGPASPAARLGAGPATDRVEVCRAIIVPAIGLEPSCGMQARKLPPTRPSPAPHRQLLSQGQEATSGLCIPGDALDDHQTQPTISKSLPL